MFSSSEDDAPPPPRPKPKQRFKKAIPLDRDAILQEADKAERAAMSSVAQGGQLVPERDDGDVEYKWRLVDVSASRFTHLCSQMKYRVLEGSGVCTYEIGVLDNGLITGLPAPEYLESIATIAAMGRAINCSVELNAQRAVRPKAGASAHRPVKEATLVGAAQFASSAITASTAAPIDVAPLPLQPAVLGSGGADASALEVEVLDPPEYASWAALKEGESEFSVDELRSMGGWDLPPRNSTLWWCGELRVCDLGPAPPSQLRVCVTGSHGAGKSTLVASVCTGAEDCGKGSARQNVFRHSHEFESGTTTSTSAAYCALQRVERGGEFASSGDASASARGGAAGGAGAEEGGVQWVLASDAIAAQLRSGSGRPARRAGGDDVKDGGKGAQRGKGGGVSSGDGDGGGGGRVDDEAEGERDGGDAVDDVRFLSVFDLPGRARSLKTALGGLCTLAPDVVLVCVSATDPSLGRSARASVSLAAQMRAPIVVVITKADLVGEGAGAEMGRRGATDAAPSHSGNGGPSLDSIAARVGEEVRALVQRCAASASSMDSAAVALARARTAVRRRRANHNDLSGNAAAAATPSGGSVSAVPTARLGPLSAASGGEHSSLLCLSPTTSPRPLVAVAVEVVRVRSHADAVAAGEAVRLRAPVHFTPSMTAAVTMDTPALRGGAADAHGATLLGRGEADLAGTAGHEEEPMCAMPGGDTVLRGPLGDDGVARRGDGAVPSTTSGAAHTPASAPRVVIPVVTVSTLSGHTSSVAVLLTLLASVGVASQVPSSATTTRLPLPAAPVASDPPSTTSPSNTFPSASLPLHPPPSALPVVPKWFGCAPCFAAVACVNATFDVPSVGCVAHIVVSAGMLCAGATVVIGPDAVGRWRIATVRSMRVLVHKPVESVGAGLAASIAFGPAPDPWMRIADACTTPSASAAAAATAAADAQLTTAAASGNGGAHAVQYVHAGVSIAPPPTSTTDPSFTPPSSVCADPASHPPLTSTTLPSSSAQRHLAAERPPMRLPIPSHDPATVPDATASATQRAHGRDASNGFTTRSRNAGTPPAPFTQRACCPLRRARPCTEPPTRAIVERGMVVLAIRSSGALTDRTVRPISPPQHLVCSQSAAAQLHSPAPRGAGGAGGKKGGKRAAQAEPPATVPPSTVEGTCLLLPPPPLSALEAQQECGVICVHSHGRAGGAATPSVGTSMLTASSGAPIVTPLSPPSLRMAGGLPTPQPPSTPSCPRTVSTWAARLVVFVPTRRRVGIANRGGGRLGGLLVDGLEAGEAAVDGVGGHRGALAGGAGGPSSTPSSAAHSPSAAGPSPLSAHPHSNPSKAASTRATRTLRSPSSPVRGSAGTFPDPLAAECPEFFSDPTAGLGAGRPVRGGVVGGGACARMPQFRSARGETLGATLDTSQSSGAVSPSTAQPPAGGPPQSPTHLLPSAPRASPLSDPPAALAGDRKATVRLGGPSQRPRAACRSHSVGGLIGKKGFCTLFVGAVAYSVHLETLAVASDSHASCVSTSLLGESLESYITQCAAASQCRAVVVRAVLRKSPAVLRRGLRAAVYDPSGATFGLGGVDGLLAAAVVDVAPVFSSRPQL